MMLGGIRFAIVEAEAMSAAVKPRSYPSLSISGATVRLSTATSAIDEPEMPAKNMLNSVTTCARPPRRCPTRVWHRRIIPVSYTHLRAHETRHDLVCRLLLEKK